MTCNNWSRYSFIRVTDLISLRPLDLKWLLVQGRFILSVCVGEVTNHFSKNKKPSIKKDGRRTI